VPEQLAQSGWQARHEPEDAIVFDGQLETHFPFEANWFAAHVKQNVDESPQVRLSRSLYNGKIRSRERRWDMLTCMT
jgi:hypothetical protein